MIVVVAAVVERDGAFLVTRRPEGVHLAGLWEFPGGKIDETETHAQALTRELREELDVGCDVHDLILHTSHTYSDRTIGLYFYRCTLAGEPKAVLGQEIRWATRRELPMLGFPPADEELIKLLAESAAR